jgi:hypothetical protein
MLATGRIGADLLPGSTPRHYAAVGITKDEVKLRTICLFMYISLIGRRWQVGRAHRWSFFLPSLTVGIFTSVM